MKKINWDYLQNLALLLVVITLPMPKYSLNSQALIILIAVWLFSGGFSNKFANLKQKRYQFLSISIWFFMFIIGLTYSDSLDIGFKNIVKNLPLLAIPLVIFSQEMELKKLENILKWFSISVICCAVFALIKASYFTYMNFGNYFYNQNLASLLNIHTTYYALFCVIVLLNFIYQIMFIKNKIIYWVSIVFLLFFMYLLSSRMGIFALGVGLFPIFYNKYGLKSLLSVPVIALLIFGFLFSPNFQKREDGQDEFGTNTPTLNTRILHWQAVIDAVGETNIYFGDGSGTDKKHVYTAYNEFNFVEGVKHKYNAHNQFLEYYIYFGLMAIIVWFFCFWVWIKKIFNDYYAYQFSVFIVLICFMLTESILERQNGIVIFALLLSLILNWNFKKNEAYK
ncbi:O-antigen ligase family protein [Winogradskyella eckloniae]|uniref:O-antigen ligase family protein n=1 Tax=Winogradskyella eckloniae TaxID=1089306 RepID=UPI001564421C|nr:O-antigen ligase family protein [Winogradskyella eckloniae]NRD18525.1 O-antigen ligase family protein [Winogradskyella eckloniae]